MKSEGLNDREALEALVRGEKIRGEDSWKSIWLEIQDGKLVQASNGKCVDKRPLVSFGLNTWAIIQREYTFREAVDITGTYRLVADKDCTMVVSDTLVTSFYCGKAQVCAGKSRFSPDARYLKVGDPQ